LLATPRTRVPSRSGYYPARQATTHSDSTRYAACVAELASNGIKRAARGGAAVAEAVVRLACPLGPVPLAARGLAAVLARAVPAGGGGHSSTVVRASWWVWSSMSVVVAPNVPVRATPAAFQS
jgi:hypothetical protein